MSDLQPIHPAWVNESRCSNLTLSSNIVTDTHLTHDHLTVRMRTADKESLLADEIHETSGQKCEECFLSQEDQDYMGKIREFHVRLDMVKNIVRPGCSFEVLNTALSSISSLARTLSEMRSKQKLHASL